MATARTIMVAIEQLNNPLGSRKFGIGRPCRRQHPVAFYVNECILKAPRDCSCIACGLGCRCSPVLSGLGAADIAADLDGQVKDVMTLLLVVQVGLDTAVASVRAACFPLYPF